MLLNMWGTGVGKEWGQLIPQKEREFRGSSDGSSLEGSLPLSKPHKCADVPGQQLRLLEGSKVASTGHVGVGDELRVLDPHPLLRHVQQITGEGSKARRHVDLHTAGVGGALVRGVAAPLPHSTASRVGETD